MNNRHEIKTISDIFRVVNKDNAENFLIDFSAFVNSVILMNEICSSVGELVGEKHEKNYPESFSWIDNGEHNCTINIIPK